MPKSENENPDGPRRNRSCTDCLFCIIMIVFWAGTIVVMAWAFASGNPWLLTQTYDFRGTACGVSGSGTSDYPFTYFYQPLQNFTNTVCVAQCPTWQPGAAGPTAVQCFSPNASYTAGISNCQAANTTDINDLGANPLQYRNEPFLIYNTSLMFNRFCMPNLMNLTTAGLSVVANVTGVTETVSFLNKYISDVTNSWQYYLIIGAIAIAVSLFSLIFVRCCAGLVVWFSLILYLAAVFGLAVICGVESARLDEQSVILGTTATFAGLSAGNYYAIMIFLYVWGAVSAVIILLSIPTIMITIAIVKASAMFVYSNLTVILVPLCTGVCIAGYIVLWIAIFLYIFSVGSYTQSTNSPFSTITWNQGVRWLMAFHVLAFLWNVAFFNYYGVFTIAGGCAIWYFNSDFSAGAFFSFPVLTAAWWGLRYHLGSIALGSFILMLFWAVQLLLTYLSQYVKSLKSHGVDSRILDLFIKCLMCYVACFTRIIEFISELGYAQIAITSQNFCSSCADAFKLLASNPMKFGAVAFIGTTFVFLGKLFVAATCGVLGWLMLTYNTGLKVQLYESYLPTFFFIVIGWFVASIFFSVFGTTANTVLLCFFYDKELASKSGRPVHAPEPMKEFYEKYKADKPAP